MFKAWKNGRFIDVPPPRSREYKLPGLYEPLDGGRVIGVDTESFRIGGKLATLLVPIQTAEGGSLLEVEPGSSPLAALFDFLFDRYAVRDPWPSQTKQRRKIGNKRPGRRWTIEPVLSVWYNAEYDLGRLIAEYDGLGLMRAVAMGQDSVRVQAGAYEVEISRMIPTGSAPSFEWFIRRNKQIVRLLGRDMWGYWKQGLGRTAASLAGLGVTAKTDITANVENVFERDFNSFTAAEWAEIKKYALTDAEATRQIYLATVQLLCNVDPSVIRRDGVIPPSAPGAAAKIAFAMAGRQVWRRPPAWADQLGLDAYAGGRVFCRQRGPVSGLHVLDITSAYPDAMRYLPDPVSARYIRVKPQPYIHDEYIGRWGVLVIDGRGLCPIYPALRRHNESWGRLQYVYGPFTQIAATIPEIVIGVASGRLVVDRIHDGVIIEGCPDESFLARYVDRVYSMRLQTERGSPQNEIAKLLLNSLYGKLIEIQESNFAPLGIDGYCLVPNWAEYDRDKLSKAYVTGGLSGVERLINKWRDKPLQPGGPKMRPLYYMLEGSTYRLGHYALPVFAAQITGFVSAKLGLAAAATEALQGDTDSIFTLTPDLSDYYRVMAEAGYESPTSGLGSWEHEISEAEGLLLKPKMYSLKYHDNGKTKWKQAHHAILSLRGDEGKDFEALDAIMWELYETGRAEYHSTPRPVRLLSAARHDLTPGEFYTEQRNITLPDDPLLIQQGNHFHWRQIDL